MNDGSTPNAATAWLQRTKVALKQIKSEQKARRKAFRLEERRMKRFKNL